MTNLAAISALPIVEVDFPNSRNQQPQVRTIADIIMQPQPTTTITPTTITTPPTGIDIGTPTTRPQPATRSGVRVDPILGPQD